VQTRATCWSSRSLTSTASHSTGKAGHKRDNCRKISAQTGHGTGADSAQAEADGKDFLENLNPASLSSTYTADAGKFAKDNGINALDGAGLLRLIAQRTPEQQQELLAVAHEGEYWRPTCASCGIKLVERSPAKGGLAFWGCSNYPRCKTRMQMAAG
jgi:hypothetical protein